MSTITKTGFKAFLEAHPRMKFRCRGACSCPVARYATEVTGDTAFFTHENYCFSKDSKDRKTPKWASAFIQAFDSRMVGADVVSFSGKQALEIFNAL